jgi:hypothetical protein
MQGIPQAARQVHVFPNMATNLLAPGPLVKQGCTLQMDSQQCLIQCPNCQPIRCPINSQGLYLLPATATAYNTIDVEEYIERANQVRYAAAARELLANQARYMAATVELSEQEHQDRTENDDDGAERPGYELAEQPRHEQQEHHQSIAAADFALADNNNAERAEHENITPK